MLPLNHVVASGSCLTHLHNNGVRILGRNNDCPPAPKTRDIIPYRFIDHASCRFKYTQILRASCLVNDLIIC